jgi:hypothetical protein
MQVAPNAIKLEGKDKFNSPQKLYSPTQPSPEGYRVPTSFYKTPAGLKVGRNKIKNYICALGT